MNQKPVKHLVLRRTLQEEIITQMRPHEMLPTERELASQFHLSRMTVRQALEALISDGLVYSVRGVGTFVTEPRVSKPLTFASFSEDMRSRGYTAGSRLLDARTVPADDTLVAALGVDPETAVHRIERIRLADNVPMCHEAVHLPARLFPALLDLELTGSLYEILRTRYRVRPVRADQTIRAVVLRTRQAQLLNVPVRSPALLVKRISSDAAGRVVEFAESVYRGDRYELSTTVTRTPNT